MLIEINDPRSSQTDKEAAMKTQSRLMDVVKSNYLVLILALLGLFAFISALLIAWPAVAYIAAKLFN